MANHPEITINGPFWSARARVVGGDEDKGGVDLSPYARILFADARAMYAATPSDLYRPGTLLVLCAVDHVTIAPGTDTYRWSRPDDLTTAADTADDISAGIQSGALCLLMLETDSEAGPRTFTLLNGFIDLTVMTPVNGDDETQLLAAIGAERVISDFPLLTTHASGLSLRAAMPLPWEPEDQPRVMPLLVIKRQPDAITGGGPVGYRLSVETDRLTASEHAALIASWRDLSGYLNPPHPLNRAPSIDPFPQWVTLEIANPQTLPNLTWTMSTWGQRPNLRFDPQQVTLLVSDHKPYDSMVPPSSLARVIPDDITMTRNEDGSLQIVLSSGGLTQPPESGLHYHWNRADRAEAFDFPAMEVAYNPVETPSALRRAQGLPTPTWERSADPDTQTPLENPLLWAFMPLEDGWAQLPVLNLTE